ncbi:MAG: PH domain-containing protein [Rubrivivax sp.]|nr:PH domain-containing protein [Rubrivivax sp.]
MFKKLASEALGLSDIGVIVPPADFNKVDADDYLFSEDGERIFFLIKSKKDEYCFTNLALIHVDGDSAVSSKRTIRRYDYATHGIHHVTLETAGTIDMDIELKFQLEGGEGFSIDVRKNFIEQLKDLYKALLSISRMQAHNAKARDNALSCLEPLGQMYKLGGDAGDPQRVVAQYEALVAAVNRQQLEKLSPRDFGAVFERYLHN